MLIDVLLRILEKRFPGKGILGTNSDEPCITFHAKHPDFGDILILDDGEEVTIIAGNFTHGHFSNYDNIPQNEKEEIIAENVAGFLELVFSDQVIFWGTHKSVGGWHVLGADPLPRRKHEGDFVWSGPKQDG